MTKPRTLEEFRKKGGLARAKKYSKKQLGEWGRKGGRPRKLKVVSKRPEDRHLNIRIG